MKTLLIPLVVYLLLGVARSANQYYDANQKCNEMIDHQSLVWNTTEEIENICEWECKQGEAICHDKYRIDCVERKETTCTQSSKQECKDVTYTTCGEQKKTNCTTEKRVRVEEQLKTIWAYKNMKKCEKTWKEVNGRQRWVPIKGSCSEYVAVFPKNITIKVNVIYYHEICKNFTKFTTLEHSKRVCWDEPTVECKEIQIQTCKKVKAGKECKGEHSMVPYKTCMKYHRQRDIPYYVTEKLSVCGDNAHFTERDFRV